MSSACTTILVGVAASVLEIKLANSPWSSNNLIDWNWPKKFMQVGIDIKCMHTNFGGHGLSSYGDSPWSLKNLINWNRPKKFMQVRIDVKYMHTNLGGCGLSSFGDIATFKNGQISPSDHGL